MVNGEVGVQLLSELVIGGQKHVSVIKETSYQLYNQKP